jgi:20S proteasome subunit beta 5
MLAGVDETGANLYYINTEGSRIKGNLFSVGSGMTYAYGVLDTFYRYDMSLEEAVELGKKAIYHATNRDTGSGGVVRVYHVHKDGWTEIIAGKNVNELHYQYLKEKGLPEYDTTVGRIE